MPSARILSLDDLARKSQELRDSGKRVVMCHGTFDLMHTGQIRHLQRARREGDVLVVTLTGDAYVNKGPGRPVFGHCDGSGQHGNHAGVGGDTMAQRLSGHRHRRVIQCPLLPKRMT